MPTSDIIAEQTQDAGARVKQLQDLQAGWRAHVAQERAPALTLSLIDELFRSPMVTIPHVAKLLNVTYHSAQRHVDRLLQAGVLVQVADQPSGGVRRARNTGDHDKVREHSIVIFGRKVQSIDRPL
jgi:Fic family protein